jgi:hypothetical protein
LYMLFYSFDFCLATLKKHKQKNPKKNRAFLLNARVATTYSRAMHYHRPWSISLLSSEWDQVEQLQYSRHPCIQVKYIEAGIKIIFNLDGPWVGVLKIIFIPA